jgi:hypothetical protein
MFPIFSFVAIWHDIEGRLLAWGWLIALFILPEIMATNFIMLPPVRRALGDYHIHVCALGGTLNILMMMAANLVGFAVGVEGLIEMSNQILDPKGTLSYLWLAHNFCRSLFYGNGFLSAIRGHSSDVFLEGFGKKGKALILSLYLPKPFFLLNDHKLQLGCVPLLVFEF